MCTFPERSMVLPPGDCPPTVQQRSQEPAEAWGEPGCAHARPSCPARARVASPLRGHSGASDRPERPCDDSSVPEIQRGCQQQQQHSWLGRRELCAQPPPRPPHCPPHSLGTGCSLRSRRGAHQAPGPQVPRPPFPLVPHGHSGLEPSGRVCTLLRAPWNLLLRLGAPSQSPN